MLTIQYSSPHDKEIEYTCKVIFEEWLGIDYQLRKSEGIRGIELLGVSNKKIVMPLTLLSDRNISLLTPFMPELPLRERTLDDLGEEFIEKTLPVIFGESLEKNIDVKSQNIYFDIDIISSVFFCLTRVEELWIEEKDEHERFSYQHSLFYKAGIHHRAIANEYVEVLWSLIKRVHSSLVRKNRTYRALPSHDVDLPLQSLKGSWKNIKSLGGDILVRKDADLFKNHISSLYGDTQKRYEKDPYNSFSYIMDVSEKYNLKSTFNFIPIHGKGGVDGHYDISSDVIKGIIKEIYDRGHLLGFHPSYHSYNDEVQFRKEVGRFKQVMEEIGVEQETWGGRQHYLRWENPTTWNLWNDAGFNYDSTLGINNRVGFRSGVCYGHTVYDVKSRKQLKLIERPLIYMDVNGDREIEEPMDLLQKLTTTVKWFRGDMTFLYHNNYLRTKEEKENYDKMINIIAT